MRNLLAAALLCAAALPGAVIFQPVGNATATTGFGDTLTISGVTLDIPPLDLTGSQSIDFLFPMRLDLVNEPGFRVRGIPVEFAVIEDGTELGIVSVQLQMAVLDSGWEVSLVPSDPSGFRVYWGESSSVISIGMLGYGQYGDGLGADLMAPARLIVTAAPEPSTYVTALFGIAACLIVRSRRTRRGSHSRC
jgi:hypothetical protein